MQTLGSRRRRRRGGRGRGGLAGGVISCQRLELTSTRIHHSLEASVVGPTVDDDGCETGTPRRESRRPAARLRRNEIELRRRARSTSSCTARQPHEEGSRGGAGRPFPCRPVLRLFEGPRDHPFLLQAAALMSDERPSMREPADPKIKPGRANGTAGCAEAVWRSRGRRKLIRRRVLLVRR